MYIAMRYVDSASLIVIAHVRNVNIQLYLKSDKSLYFYIKISYI